ncbi:nucleotidyltransferase domain-containing protein [Candidatus Bathyarchaeota archaeon]|nr:nucleotidyltransferase domain-containing protein [Candidatus Bathyarchaeota archaeon]
MNGREGDIVETDARILFDVKGLIHPANRIVAFIRYFPDLEGKRRKNGIAFEKIYSLPERYALLKARFPRYLVYDPVLDETICEVPVNEIKKHYKPCDGLRELHASSHLDELGSKALQLTDALRERANIPHNSVGISGSILIGLHTPKSDIDPIIYGSENCYRVHSTLRELLNSENETFKSYTKEELRTLFDFRSKDTTTGFKDFVRTESRKAIQGKFMGTDYFVRFVKDWNEIDEKYGDIQYKNVGYARIKAVISDCSESIFTPCKYKIEQVTVIEGTGLPIQEIASFRGRFCEQARNGETVVAQGKVERVIDNKHNREWFRLLLGNNPSDFVILAKLD